MTAPAFGFFELSLKMNASIKFSKMLPLKNAAVKQLLRPH
jgi:hypothetical protein